MKIYIFLPFLFLPFLFTGCDKEMQENENIESVAVPLSLIIGYEEFDDITLPETRSIQKLFRLLYNP